MKLLYLSYDGMTDQLGRAQVLPYLEGLSGKGHRIWLVSFEKADASPQAWDRVRKLCAEAGIEWQPLRYHKRPPVLSTMWDVMQMRRKALQLHRSISFELVHCRSYIAALVGLTMKRRFGTPFLFDMRGFWPDERVEGGTWKLENPLFRAVFNYFKRRERDFLSEADAVVSLTNAAADELASRPAGQGPSTRPDVIPCCVDMSHFRLSSAEGRLAARHELGIPADAPVLGYLGTLGTYYLFEEMLRFFLAYRERNPGARFLFVSREDPIFIRDAAARHGIDRDQLFMRGADREDVPHLISVADAGISFIMPTYSKTASSPTKLGEMMALGIPMVVNAGVGDVDAVMADTRAGVVVDRFGDDALAAAVEALSTFEHDPQRIRGGAQRWFSLEKGVAAYDAIYLRIGQGHR